MCMNTGVQINPAFLAPRASGCSNSTNGSSRTSIRERCGITFSLPPINIVHDVSYGMPKGYLEPSVGNLPRRKKPGIVVVPPRDVVPSLPLSKETSPSGCSTPRRIELTCPQPIVPGLLVAFVEDTSDGYFIKYEDRNVNKSVTLSILSNFTHVVNVSTGTNHGSAEESLDPHTGTHRIRLVVPTRTTDAGVTHLTAHQLLAARAFLSVAMPYSPHFRLGSPFLQRCRVRLLITAPRDRPVDAISVAACFLAYTLGISAEEVLTHINDKEDFSRLWQGTVSSDGMKFINNVAGW